MTLPWELPLIGRTLSVPMYGVMLAVGAVAGTWLAARRAEKAGFSRQEVVDVAVYCVLLGVVGARLFYVLEHFGYFSSSWRNFLHAFAIWEGGLVYYGGLILAVLYIAYHFMRKDNAWEELVKMWDLAAPSAMAGLAFGRLGCLFNGCCYGKPSGVPWALKFPRGSPIFADVTDPGSLVYQRYYHLAVEHGMTGGGAGRSFAVHPTQLYSAAAVFLIAGFLYWYWPRRKGNGEVGGLMLMLYCPFRFLVEFLRINPATFSWAPLSIAQWVSIPAFLYGMYLVLGSRGIINPHWKALHPLKEKEAGDTAGAQSSGQ